MRDVKANLKEVLFIININYTKTNKKHNILILLLKVRDIKYAKPVKPLALLYAKEEFIIIL
jgi:hypothetical protein